MTLENYGRFNKEEGCFILKEEPPRKWVNLHYNKVGGTEIFCEATNIGDGVTCVRDDDGVMYDLVGYDCKYVYVRDDETNTVFNPGGHPVPTPVTDYECRYYREKTELTATCEGIKATQRIFIPRDYINEIWTVTLDNLTERPRTVSLFAYAFFDVSGFNIERKRINRENYSEILKDAPGVLVINRNKLAPNDRFKAYLTTLNRQEFTNANGYRDDFLFQDFSVAAPRILRGWNCDGLTSFGPDCAGIVQLRFTIPPHSSVRADFLIGQASSQEDAARQTAAFTPEKIDRLCEEQKRVHTELCTAFQIDTGHKNIDALMNHFVKKQVQGYLVHKAGFRDNVQIDNCLAMIDYQSAKSNLLRALSSQFATGGIPHSFRPMNRKVYADMPCWPMQTVAGMIRETGDWALLDEVVPFFESNEKGTVWEHLIRGLRYESRDLGKNGLCDQRMGDWNDGLEPTQEAGARESVMVTQQVCQGCLDMIEMAQRKGDKAIEEEVREIHRSLSQRINEVAWDGEWYVRTICGDGYRIGSKTAEEAKIFMNTQAWAVLGGVASPERAKQCMDAVEKYCKTDYGYKILWPAFTKYDPRTGMISNFMPDTRTNGGCYNHAAGYKGVADCMLGRAEEAWGTFIRVAPDSPFNPIGKSGAEPFTFVNFFVPIRQVTGNSGYGWRTGTSGWFTMLMVEWILGARRHFDGLMIDPCLTKTVPHAKITRRFRGAFYHIELDNTAGRCKGATSITVDGQKIAGNILPLFKEGEHRVQVVI